MDTVQHHLCESVGCTLVDEVEWILYNKGGQLLFISEM